MRRVDPGQIVAAGTPVFSIAQLNPVKVRVGVPEADIGMVRQSAAAEISVPSLGGQRFTGKVAIIGVAGEPASRTYTVKILVPNPGPVLLAGMVAEARIFGPAKIRAVTIPAEAVVPDAQGAPTVYVYFPDRKRVFARRVECGAPMGSEVEIRSGVRSGEQIVVVGQQKVREGSLVEVSGGAK
jgi:membrane fusion protein (multidrug efflux system)